MALAAMCLVACGGDGGSDGGGGGSSSSVAGPEALALTPAAQCTSAAPCSGTQLLYADNTGGSSAATLSVDLRGSKISLVLANGGAASPASVPLSSGSPMAEYMGPGANQVPDRIRHHKPLPISREAQPSARQAFQADVAPSTPAVGDTRTWKDANGASHAATLERRWQAPDGRWLDLWVETAELGVNKVTSAMIDTMQAKFSPVTLPSGDDGIYGMVSSLAGAPWGSYSGSGLIAANQDLNVVLLNLTPDGQPYGLVGYFWDINAYTSSYLASFGQGYENYGNQALALFVDTETLYLDKTSGQNTVLPVMAHEMTHMAQFYQRTVLGAGGQDHGFDTWLAEMTAMMMEDVVSGNIISGYNALRDNGFASWIAQGSTGCQFIWYAWEDDSSSSCFSYPVAASYGGYLLRRYGVGFYQALMADQSSTDTFTVLNHAIVQAGGSGAWDAMRAWAPSLALLPATVPAALGGFPARTDTVAGYGYTLPAIDGTQFARYQQAVSTWPGGAFTHGELLRLQNSSGRYNASVTVPAGAELFVVLQ